MFCLISLLVGTPLPLTLIAPPTLDRHSDIIIILIKKNELLVLTFVSTKAALHPSPILRVLLNVTVHILLFDYLLSFAFVVFRFSPDFKSVTVKDFQSINCSDQKLVPFPNTSLSFKSVFLCRRGFCAALRQSGLVLGSNMEDVKTGSGRKDTHTKKGGGGKRLLGVFKVSQTAAGYYKEK